MYEKHGGKRERVMDYKYLQDKDWKFKVFVWAIMEETQEKRPYHEFGWDGFTMMIINRY